MVCVKGEGRRGGWGEVGVRLEGGEGTVAARLGGVVGVVMGVVWSGLLDGCLE